MRVSMIKQSFLAIREKSGQVASARSRGLYCTLPLVLIFVGTLPIFGGDAAGIVKGSDEFEFVYRVKLPEITGEARLWIPLAKTDAFQTVTREEVSIPIKWEKIQDRDYGNDICVLYPQSVDSGKTIELRYLVVRKEKAAYSANGEDPTRFLRPEKLV